MGIKTFFKFLFPLVLYFGIVGGGYYFFLLPQVMIDKPIPIVKDQSFGWKFPVAKFPLTGSNGKQIAYSDIRDPGGISQGLPVRLKIPVIGVDSAIEDALITPDGRMDVPAGSKNVAWFALGPHPGQEGSAVIGGHFGVSNGVPWVFYNLDKLKVGDKVFVVDDNDKTLAFIVRATKSFDRNADSTSVFTSSDGRAHLNLITCEGIWNQVNDSYPQRLVVFTDAIPDEGAVEVKKIVPTVAKGTTPEDRSVVAKKSPTVSPTPEPSVLPTVEPSILPTASPFLNEKNSPSIPQTIIASAKSLFATPLDGLITFSLLISIVLIGIKIIRR